jgi:hypothetical protein
MLTKSLVLMITDSLVLVWAESASDPFTGTWKAKGAIRELQALAENRTRFGGEYGDGICGSRRCRRDIRMAAEGPMKRVTAESSAIGVAHLRSIPPRSTLYRIETPYRSTIAAKASPVRRYRFHPAGTFSAFSKRGSIPDPGPKAQK